MESWRQICVKRDANGVRENEASWKELLLDLRDRGMSEDPKLAIDDGALGFWKALPQVFPTTRMQRCWVHKTANVLNKLPKAAQPRAKTLIHDIYRAETKSAATRVFMHFCDSYRDKYPDAVKCLERDADVLLTFYSFPRSTYGRSRIWKHIRSTNVIESVFATVRLRTYKTKGMGTSTTTLAMAFKLIKEAEKPGGRSPAGDSWNSSNKDVYSRTASWFRKNQPHRIGIRRDAHPPNLTVSPMQRALQLSGKSPNTQESYLRSVRQVADHCGKDPQEIAENELEEYILFRRNESRWKPATLRLCYAGLKFYYQRVLDRQWKLFTILHAEDERRLPVVLTQTEVSKILSHVRTFHNFTFLSTVYACGLRLAEALALTIDDIDAEAMLVHVRRGKGRADRTVPLPTDTLSVLRPYWLTHRNPHLIFPALGRGQKGGRRAQEPMNRESVQGAMRRAKTAAGITLIARLDPYSSP